MKIPLANAIFDGKLEIDNFLKKEITEIFKIYYSEKLIRKFFHVFFLNMR